MISRIIFTLVNLQKHRNALQAYRDDPALNIKNVLEIDPLLLKTQQGIQALVLDFDGVLAAHGDVKADSELENWLKKCVAVFGSGFVFILSNKPTKARQQYFNEHFTGIEFFVSPKKKPYPDGIQAILKQTKLKPETLLIIDDRLLTGILAALLAKSKARYVTEPRINYYKRPLTEFFFVCLRKIEHWII